MSAVVLAADFYSTLATSVLFVHALFILWVVFGAFPVRSHPILRRPHVISLVWGILTEVLPWPCPLLCWRTGSSCRAGIEPHQGGFLLHPDVSASVLTAAGVI